MTFKDLRAIMIRELKAEIQMGPYIFLYGLMFKIQIYANYVAPSNPANTTLQFNITHLNRSEKEPEPELKFWESGPEKRKYFTVQARNSISGKTRKETFMFEESIEELTKKFPEEPHIGEIVEGILLLQ